MIEGQRRRQDTQTKQFRLCGIVLRLRCAVRLGKVYRTHGMSARVALRCGITTQQHFQRHVQTRFFQGLTYRRLFQAFPRWGLSTISMMISAATSGVTGVAMHPPQNTLAA